MRRIDITELLEYVPIDVRLRLKEAVELSEVVRVGEVRQRHNGEEVCSGASFLKFLCQCAADARPIALINTCCLRQVVSCELFLHKWSKLVLNLHKPFSRET